MKRRVALLTETFLPEIGGGETQARALADAMHARGYIVEIITRRSREALSAREDYEGYRVHRVGPAGVGRWRKWGLTATVLPPLFSRAHAPHALLVSGFRILGAPAVAAARFLGIPCVLKADSTGEMSGEFYRAGLRQAGLSVNGWPARLFLALRNRLLRRASAFVALSREMADEYAAGGVPRERIHQIPNGIDTAHFAPVNDATRQALRKTLGLPAGPVVVYTGRLVTYKGLPLLLDTWDQLVQTGECGTLVLVGAGSADMHNCESALRDAVAVRRLQDRVIFTGGVTDVAPFLRAADAFVFPTENEAFGLSLVEAMACGLPVVSTLVGGIVDFLRDGENGIAVPVGDRERLAAALRRVIAGGAEVAALGHAARATVERTFSRETVADAYAALFDSLRVARTGSVESTR